MEIKQMQTQDIPAVCALAREVFDQVLASTYTEEGRQTFYAFIEESAMQARLSDGGFGLVAFLDGTLVSLIEIGRTGCIAVQEAGQQCGGNQRQRCTLGSRGLPTLWVQAVCS